MLYFLCEAGGEESGRGGGGEGEGRGGERGEKRKRRE